MWTAAVAVVMVVVEFALGAEDMVVVIAVYAME